MKILILANFDLGLYQFRKELITELLKENEVYISLPYGDLVKPLIEMGCVFIETPMERRGMNPLKDVSLLREYFSLLKKIKPDFVITYTIKPNVYGGFACRIKRVSYAVNITGLGTAFQKKGVLRLMVTFMYKAALRKAKVVFFENSANRDLFVKEGIVKKKQTCLLNGAGVNLEHFSYMEYPHNDTFHFLFIGRVMREKGIDELFEAMRQLLKEGEKCVLDVVGPYEDDYTEILDQYTKEGWLNYYGYQKDVRPYIRACDCFVLPSWHEGMANTNLECAACGRPIITSNIPGCKEAVIDGVSGYLCEPQNAYSLCSSMKKMMEMYVKTRINFGIQGRRYMTEKFSKNDVIIKTIQRLYD